MSLQIIIADLAQPVVETAVRFHASPQSETSSNVTVDGPRSSSSSFYTHPSSSFSPKWAAIVSSRAFITTCSLATVYPLTLAKSVSALGAASSAAFVILFGVAAALVVRFAQAGAPVGPGVTPANFDHPAAVALALPVVALSYSCHFNVVDIDHELPPGRAKRCINGIIHVSILGIAFPFYLVFATVGYLQFGADVSGDLLTEWMGDDVMTVAQVAVAGVNVLKYPLLGFGLKRMIAVSYTHLTLPTILLV